jgi:hypothetical protein
MVWEEPLDKLKLINSELQLTQKELKSKPQLHLRKLNKFQLKKFLKKDLTQTTLRWLWNTQNALRLKPLRFLEKLTTIQSMPS